MTFGVLPLLAGLACSPGRFVESMDGFESYDDAVPAQTSTGSEPQFAATPILVSGSNAYFQFQVDQYDEAPVTHLFIEIEDEVFVGTISEFAVMDYCEILEESGTLTCTQECADACSCIADCALYDQYSLYGYDDSTGGLTDAGLCTASCSLAMSYDTYGVWTSAEEYAEIYDDIYECSGSCTTSQTTTTWVGMVETNYPNIKTEAVTVTPVSAPSGVGITGSGTPQDLKVGGSQMCRKH